MAYEPSSLQYIFIDVTMNISAHNECAQVETVIAWRQHLQKHSGSQVTEICDYEGVSVPDGSQIRHII